MATGLATELANKLANNEWKRGLGALKSKRRATGRAQASLTKRTLQQTRTLQQARGTKTGNRIGYRHCLTLKNPARHPNSQRRITQMPNFHTITPPNAPLPPNHLPP